MSKRKAPPADPPKPLTIADWIAAFGFLSDMCKDRCRELQAVKAENEHLRKALRAAQEQGRPTDGTLGGQKE